MNSIERKQASLERRTRERMREREDEMGSVSSEVVKDNDRRIVKHSNKTRSEPSCFKKQGSDTDLISYYDKYYKKQDFDPP